jgi:S-(hydroxymethyl)glutathione dehydrogenase/alcohol dehydrogenase
MKTRAAILREVGQPWSVEEIELDPPKRGEVLVKMSASGMCHSDEHAMDGHIAGLVPPAPMIGGHEGSGVVVEVGEGVDGLEAGDHVVFGFIPACGRCASCADGHSNLCDTGLVTFPEGTQMLDGTARHHTAQGEDLGLMCLLGTFAEHTVVNEASVIKIDKDWPLDKACLLGCGVVTGWGSAVYAAETGPGDYVAVVGCGGIGMNAVQGAAMTGARAVVAIDPVEFKREKAMAFGATHAFASIAEAQAAMGEVTWDRGYDKVIMTMGTGDSQTLGEAFNLGGKRSKIVVTNLHSTAEGSVDVPAIMLTMFEKQLIGSLFGSANIRKDIPKLFELYIEGQLNLDDLVTKTYTLDEINEGYEAMRAGENVRGVILFD